MKIDELKERMISESFNTIIEFKSYLPFLEKKLLVEAILDSCLQTDDNGIITCDYFMKKMVSDIKIILAYTDIEFSDNVVEEYDFLVQNKVLDHIMVNIDGNELDMINDFIYYELRQRIEIGNSLSNILAVGIQKLIDKIPDNKQIKSLSKSLAKDLKGFNWDSVPMLKQIYETAQGKNFK